MKLVVAAVGRARDAAVRTLLDDYYARIQRYGAIEEIELRDERADKLDAAFTRIIRGAGERAELVALDVAGRSLSSDAFARALGVLQDGARIPVFAIGGAEGLPRALRERAAWQLSLGPMTLPHRLARVVLAEQIYRAFTILKGEPYAREG